MKYFCCLLLTLMMNTHANESLGKLIFADDFNRNESSEEKEEPGNGWETNSKSRALGNKQIDLRDGAFHIVTHPKADHAAVVKHSFKFQDGSITMRVKLEDKKDSLKINIADPSEKSVHAGHLLNIDIFTWKVALTDLKTGNMKLEMREARKNKTITKKKTKLYAK